MSTPPHAGRESESMALDPPQHTRTTETPARILHARPEEATQAEQAASGRGSVLYDGAAVEAAGEREAGLSCDRGFCPPGELRYSATAPEELRYSSAAPEGLRYSGATPEA